MKKIASILLALVLAAAVCGCTSGDYKKAQSLLEQGNYLEAEELFFALGDYEDSADLAKECRYQWAQTLIPGKEFASAIEAFTELGDYKDSADFLNESRYQLALHYYEQADYDSAMPVFTQIIEYKDSEQYAKGCIFEKASAAYENGYVKEAVDALSKVFDYPGARTKLCQIMLDEITQQYASEGIEASSDLNAYTKTWLAQFKRNYNNTKAGKTIEIPKVDPEDADVMSLNRHVGKMDAFVASFSDIFNDDVMGRCDESMQSFKEVFLKSADTIHSHFTQLDSYFQMALYYSSMNMSISKVNTSYNAALYAIMDAAEELGGIDLGGMKSE